MCSHDRSLRGVISEIVPSRGPHRTATIVDHHMDGWGKQKPSPHEVNTKTQVNAPETRRVRMTFILLIMEYILSIHLDGDFQCGISKAKERVCLICLCTS